MNNCDSPAVKKTKLMQNNELHHLALPASKKISCAPKLCKECHPHSKKPLDSVIENFNKDEDIYKLTNKPALTKAMDLLEVSIEKYKAVKAKLKKTQNVWQASITENVELRAVKRELVIEIEELKNICTKKQLAELEYILKRNKKDKEKG